MSQELENRLKLVLLKLEKAYGDILKTQGYNENTEKLKMLCELTREQISNEDHSHTAR